MFYIYTYYRFKHTCMCNIYLIFSELILGEIISFAEVSCPFRCFGFAVGYIMY